MRFLADECRPKPVVEALRSEGHDLAYAAEAYRGVSDDRILSLAFEQDRLILTEDFDFGELAIRRGLPTHGVVLLAMGGEPVSARVRRISELVARHADDLRGHLTIVDAQRIRRRPLVPS